MPRATTCSPVRSAPAAAVATGAATAAGAFQFAPPALTMCTTAACTSTSVRSGLPPFAGIARMPLIACSYVSLSPWAITFAHAALSPNLCAPATPASWQTLQTCA